MTYEIRPAAVRDLDAVLHHRRRMFEDMGYADPEALDAMIAVSAPLLAQGLEDGSYHGWLAESADGAIVAGGGVAIFKFLPHVQDPRPQRAWIVNLFTEREHRRQGLARRLMQAIVDWCRIEGLRIVFLHASEDGRALYESMGFEMNNEMRLALK